MGGGTRSQNKISVIIPMFNASGSIKTTLTSICNQVGVDSEIIVIDDNSTDDSVELVRDIMKEEPRIKLVAKDINEGVSAARNKELELATGEFVYFMDADDYCDCDTLQFLMSLMTAQERCDVSICGFYRNEVRVKEENITPVYLQGRELVRALLGMDSYKCKGYLWNKLFRKSIIDINHLLFDTEVHVGEDLLFCVQYALSCVGAMYDSRPKYHYLVHSGSATNSGVSVRRMSGIKGDVKLKQCCEPIMDEELSERLDSIAWFGCISLLKKLAPCLSQEQIAFNHQILSVLRGKTTSILLSKYISGKRKILFFAVGIIAVTKEVVLYRTRKSTK